MVGDDVNDDRCWLLPVFRWLWVMASLLAGTLTDLIVPSDGL